MTYIRPGTAGHPGVSRCHDTPRYSQGTPTNGLTPQILLTNCNIVPVFQLKSNNVRICRMLQMFDVLSPDRSYAAKLNAATCVLNQLLLDVIMGVHLWDMSSPKFRLEKGYGPVPTDLASE